MSVSDNHPEHKWREELLRKIRDAIGRNVTRTNGPAVYAVRGTVGYVPDGTPSLATSPTSNATCCCHFHKKINHMLTFFMLQQSFR